MTGAGLDLNSEESWRIARRFAKLLQPIPSSVSSALPVLWAAQDLNEQTLARCCRATRQIEKSAMLRTPLYFAALQLYPERLRKMQQDDSNLVLLQALGPQLFGGLLGMVYLHRRLNKIAKSTMWENLSKEIVLNMELGYLLGTVFAAAGPATGALYGGIRYAALATFLLKDEQGYHRYRIDRKKRFDTEFEHSAWGCDHCQISCYLLEALGFNINLHQIVQVLRHARPEKELPPELQAAQALVHWIDQVKSGNPPSSDDPFTPALQCTPELAKSAHVLIDGLFTGNSMFSWMFRAVGSSA